MAWAELDGNLHYYRPRPQAPTWEHQHTHHIGVPLLRESSSAEAAPENEELPWLIIGFLHQDRASWKHTTNRFIHTCTGSTVFHCEIVLPAANAVWTVDAGSPVHFTPLNRKTYHDRNWEAYWIHSERWQYDAVRRFLMRQEGKMIDMKGFWGFFLPKWLTGGGGDRHAALHSTDNSATGNDPAMAERFFRLDRERWLCSRLIASALVFADLLPGDIDIEHVTPSGLRTLVLERSKRRVGAADLGALSSPAPASIR